MLQIIHPVPVELTLIVGYPVVANEALASESAREGSGSVGGPMRYEEGDVLLETLQIIPVADAVHHVENVRMAADQALSLW
jgi:hypothetical protein